MLLLLHGDIGNVRSSHLLQRDGDSGQSPRDRGRWPWVTEDWRQSHGQGRGRNMGVVAVLLLEHTWRSRTHEGETVTSLAPPLVSKEWWPLLSSRRLLPWRLDLGRQEGEISEVEVGGRSLHRRGAWMVAVIFSCHGERVVVR